jgi:hypothetical protein
MAHFAWIDDNNVVYQVSTVNNDDIGNLDFPESEPVGIAYLSSVYGETLNWKQCSYNANFRAFYPGIGWTYDLVIDEFVPPAVTNEIE